MYSLSGYFGIGITDIKEMLIGEELSFLVHKAVIETPSY